MAGLVKTFDVQLLIGPTAALSTWSVCSADGSASAHAEVARRWVGHASQCPTTLTPATNSHNGRRQRRQMSTSNSEQVWVK
jgi:hypothetical protein